MVDTDGLYVPMLASVLTRGTPLLSLLQDLGILVASHLGIQKAQTGYSRSSVGSFMFFASEWFQDCFSSNE